MMKTNRRGFMKQAALALAALPFLKGALSVLAPTTAEAKTKAKKQVPLPAGATEAQQSDPVVQALGYKPDATTVTDPMRKKPEAKNQFCKNCALYTPSNEGWGKCQLIANGLVNTNGWCRSWSKKQ